MFRLSLCLLALLAFHGTKITADQGKQPPPHNIGLSKEGVIQHLDNFATVSKTFDLARQLICTTVTITRDDAGAATETKCWPGKDARLTITRIGRTAHGDNFITHFKIADDLNGYACFGSIVTRKGAGADISLDCLH